MNNEICLEILSLTQPFQPIGFLAGCRHTSAVGDFLFPQIPLVNRQVVSGDSLKVKSILSFHGHCPCPNSGPWQSVPVGFWPLVSPSLIHSLYCPQSILSKMNGHVLYRIKSKLHNLVLKVLSNVGMTWISNLHVSFYPEMYKGITSIIYCHMNSVLYSTLSGLKQQ